MKKLILKNDRYRKARGGHARLLVISCTRCGEYLFSYQKDGPGILKRAYFDRIMKAMTNYQSKLICPQCKEVLGVPMIYKKEKRPAIRFFEGAVAKKITKINKK